MELMAADAFLAAAKQVEGDKPFMERYLGAFKNCTYGYGEMLTAVIANT